MELNPSPYSKIYTLPVDGELTLAETGEDVGGSDTWASREEVPSRKYSTVLSSVHHGTVRQWGERARLIGVCSEARAYQRLL